MISKVRLSAECYMQCVHHALTTEREEIVGLLFGEIKVSVACLWCPSGMSSKHHSRNRGTRLR